MFWKKIIYIDRLADYHNIPCWDFRLLDKVIVVGTTYTQDEYKIWKKWILIHKDRHWECILIDPQGKMLYVHWTLKKDYWEFQEEFEALEETERLSLEVQEKLQRLEQLKKKTDKIKDLNLKNLWL